MVTSAMLQGVTHHVLFEESSVAKSMVIGETAGTSIDSNTDSLLLPLGHFCNDRGKETGQSERGYEAQPRGCKHLACY